MTIFMHLRNTNSVNEMLSAYLLQVLHCNFIVFVIIALPFRVFIFQAHSADFYCATIFFFLFCVFEECVIYSSPNPCS